MLQQTTVAAVKPYFERFVAAFPTVDDLAAADEQQVLRLWEGLGYYRRARGLHAAAKQIVGEHGGEFPRDVPTLMALPGVGRYTAGAIASIAFDVPAPILEANTMRLLSRLVGYRGDPTKARGPAAAVANGRGRCCRGRAWRGSTRRSWSWARSSARRRRRGATRARWRRTARRSRWGCRRRFPRLAAKPKRRPRCARRRSSCGETAPCCCGSAPRASGGRGCGTSRGSRSRPRGRCSSATSWSPRCASKPASTIEPGGAAQDAQARRHAVPHHARVLRSAGPSAAACARRPRGPCAGRRAASLPSLPLSVTGRKIARLIDGESPRLVEPLVRGIERGDRHVQHAQLADGPVPAERLDENRVAGPHGVPLAVELHLALAFEDVVDLGEPLVVVRRASRR